MSRAGTCLRVPTYLKRSFSIRVQAELAFAIALAAVLSLFKLKLPHLLYGGSVSLDSVPLFVAAFRHGPAAGGMAGLAYGFVHFAMSPYFVHPIQLALDYPLAYATVGIAAPGASRRAGEKGFAWPRLAAAIAVAEAVRLGLHFLSGIVYFGHLAPEGMEVWRYSLGYNASYLIPEVVLYILLVPMVLRTTTSSDRGMTGPLGKLTFSGGIP